MRMPGQVYKKVCVVCGKRFNAKRTHAKCCSAACRNTLSRDKSARVDEVVLETGGKIPVDELNDICKVVAQVLSIENKPRIVKPFYQDKVYRYRIGSMGVATNSKYQLYRFAFADDAKLYAVRHGWFAEHGKDLIIEGTSVYVPDGWKSR